MSLPKIVCFSIALALSCFCIAFAKEAPDKKAKASFTVLYNNDGYNCTGCVQPGQTKRLPFSQELLERTVDETAGTGVEVHILQPGVGWVPWWQSKVCPDWIQWYCDSTGRKPTSRHKYLLAGGDMVEAFVKRCREKKLVPFISYRLNDTHGRRMSEEPWWSGDVMGQFYMEHPEYRIGPDLLSWYERAQNWAIPEVRDYKFALMNEIIENYDLDGFELDFLRHCSLFQLDKTTSEQRKEIMTRFVAKVRKSLDDNTKPGEHKWLCVRIPSYLDTHDALGIDVKQLVSAGVDMINLSGFFYTEQQSDIGKITKLVPETPVYLELNHLIQSGTNVAKHRHGSFTFRRTTEKQYYTTAHLAYAQGASGVSLFNFAYYRDNGVPGRGPFHEPPFAIFKNLGDKEWVAKQDQHYLLGKVGNTPPSKTRQMPKKFTKGVTHSIQMVMAEPTGGWKQDGKLRIEGDRSLGDSKWTVTFNGVKLEETLDRSEPYETPYQNLLGEAEQYRAFVLPFGIAKNGDNEIQVTMTDGDRKQTILFMDIAIQ